MQISLTSRLTHERIMEISVECWSQSHKLQTAEHRGWSASRPLINTINLISRHNQSAVYIPLYPTQSHPSTKTQSKYISCMSLSSNFNGIGFIRVCWYSCNWSCEDLREPNIQIQIRITIYLHMNNQPCKFHVSTCMLYCVRPLDQYHSTSSFISINVCSIHHQPHHPQLWNIRVHFICNKVHFVLSRCH